MWPTQTPARHQLSSEVTTCPGPTHSFSPGESSPAGKAELTGPHFSLLMTAQARMALGVSRMDVARQDSALRHKPGFSWGNRGAYRGSRWAPLDPRVGSPASGPEARKNPASSQVVSPPHTLPPAVCPASHQGRGLFLGIPIFPFISPSAPRQP